MKLIKNFTVMSFSLFLLHTSVTSQPAIQSNQANQDLQIQELKMELLKAKEEKERLSRLKAQQHLIKEPSPSHPPPKATNVSVFKWFETGGLIS
jgi:hypothetical protein